MYFLFPYRKRLTTSPELSIPERMDQLATADEVVIMHREAQRMSVVKHDEQDEWLAPIAEVAWTNAPEVRLILRPRRWLRRMFLGELCLFTLIMVWLWSNAYWQPGLLVCGLVIINHVFIFLLMRYRFLATSHWLSEQLAAVSDRSA